MNKVGKLAGKRVLLGVSGGIAAYKSPDLVRRLKEAGAEVQVVMTAGAQRFITPLTLQAVSGRPVRIDLWDAAAEHAMGHIELGRWADRVLVAPASADFLAHLAQGTAADLLTTLCLATTAPVAVAPAGFTDATIVTGVEPPPGASVSQAQSEPGVVVKASPLEGLVLLTVIFCAAGKVPPTV